MRALHAHLSIENNNATIYQLKAAENVKTLTLITVIFSPLTLAASLFGTQQGVLPFAPSFQSFGYFTIVLALMLLASLTLLRHWDIWTQHLVSLTHRLGSDLSFHEPTAMGGGATGESETNGEQQAATSFGSPPKKRPTWPFLKGAKVEM